MELSSIVIVLVIALMIGLVIVAIAVIYKEAHINRGEQREYEGLNQANQQFHKVENWEEACPVQEVFAAEDVAKQAH